MGCCFVVLKRANKYGNIILVIRMKERPVRKTIRLKNYDYSTPGAYFITICTKNREQMLSEIFVGTDVLGGPCATNELTNYGKVADKYIKQINDFYDDISIDKYVIMPNHIHLLIRIIGDVKNENGNKCIGVHGPPRTSVPTKSTISRFISTFKRFCNKEYGENIWQYRSHDHIIRTDNEYRKIWEYIDTNPFLWKEDCFYQTEE